MIEREKYFKDLYRPKFHYSAESHIINDPNGLFYYEGEYHLMHQYNINNHIHWGHAVSHDLVHWEHLPAALAPDNIGQIWSGSAVVDWENTSGLQCGREKVIVALFTYNEHVDAQQSQGLAYSNDRGRTWKKYEQNPVLTSKGNTDFRDPKVFWYEDNNCWITVLACCDHVEFYRSSNLIDWQFSGEFGLKDGSHEGIWECPDLFRLPVENCHGESRWVLLVSVNNGAPAGGTGMQYFVGSFDGKKFVNDYPEEKVLWLDYGKDFYAGVTWNNIPGGDNRRLIIGWVDNWLYRDDLPTSLFKGQLSSVRELKLFLVRDEIRVTQQPIKEIQCLRGDTYNLKTYVNESDCKWQVPVNAEAFELDCELEFRNDNDIVELVIEGNNNNYLKLIYDRERECLIFDRTHCGNYEIPEFEGIFQVPLRIRNNLLKLQLLVDVSQIEVFADDGFVVMTNLFFSDCCGCIMIEAKESTVKLINGNYYELDSVWLEKKDNFEQLGKVVAGNWAQTIWGLEGDSEKEGTLVSSNSYYNFKIEAKIKIMPYRDGKAAGFVFGMNAEEVEYRLLFDAEENVVRLLQGINEVCKEAVSINVERTYHISIEVNERNFKFCCDGITMMREGLNEYTGGALGVCVVSSNAIFNNIQIN